MSSLYTVYLSFLSLKSTNCYTIFMLCSLSCTFSISLSTKMLYPLLALPRVPDSWLRNSSVARKFIFIRSTCCAKFFLTFIKKIVVLRRRRGLDFIVTVLRTGGFEVRIPTGARDFFFSSPKRPDRLWGPLTPLANAYRR